MRLAANDNCLRGRLIRLAMATEATSVAVSAMPVQIIKVLWFSRLPCVASACSQ